jgi:hypothetical protein
MNYDSFYAYDYMIGEENIRDEFYPSDADSSMVLVDDDIFNVMPEFYYIGGANYDSSTTAVIVYASENININDPLPSTIAIMVSTETVNTSDTQKVFAYLTSADSFSVSDIEKLFALIDKNEKLSLEELQSTDATIYQFESPYAMDRTPRTAYSDFVIGTQDPYDKAFDWLLPFNMMVDYSQSSIPYMPQVEHDQTEMYGVDGSTLINAEYKNRIFKIVSYSLLGLTKQEKEELKFKICEVLDEIKNASKRITFKNSDTAFDVVYSGASTISEGGSFVKSEIQFESQPYGHPLFDQEVYGSGKLTNNGDTDIGFVNTILSDAVNPEFVIGDITYRWNGTVPKNSKLIIDHTDRSCYIESFDGEKINAIDKLDGKFQLIPQGKSVEITALGNTESFLTTTLRENVLWGVTSE